MMMWHGSWSGVDWAIMSVAMLAFWSAAIGGTLWLIRASRARALSRPEGVSLDKRDETSGFAARDTAAGRHSRGELSDDDYQAPRDTLTTP